MTGSKRVLLLVGSPRGKKSSSTNLGTYLLTALQKKGLKTLQTQWIGHALRSQDKIQQMLEAIDEADIIILAAPLYDDCEPYIVIKIMELIVARQKELAKTSKESTGKIFSVIVNCAFPELHHNVAALQIYRKFASDVGFHWGGSLAISAGEALQGKEGKSLDDVGSMAKKVKGVLDRMADSFSEGSPPADEIMSIIPSFFYHGPLSFLGSLFNGINNRMWASRAKKKGEDVSARPYVE